MNYTNKMNYRVLIMSLFSVILSFFGCGKNTKENQGNFPFVAKRIKINQLNRELKLLQEGKTEYDFIGITSNGIDCIYFMKENDVFQIEFEAMIEPQIPYIEKLKDFAISKNFNHKMISYGNKPEYDAKEAPVIRIETNLKLNEVAEIGSLIQSEIFGNNSNIEFDVVP